MPTSVPAAAKPLVSFVVPCFRLAHLLGECLNSILGQTYAELEILIMDDCSPDDTAAVAASFTDPRVRYLRNEVNLGQLRNYNRGIDASRGKYVWLISADDYLRTPDILERYVQCMEANPSVGYACCAGISVVDGREAGPIRYSQCYPDDRVVAGHDFLRLLLRSNVVLAASGMVRKSCYDQHGTFPLSDGMIWSGDWYLWCLFALHHDVAYFATPMVCYRQHGLSMTTTLKTQRSIDVPVGDIAVPWMVSRLARNLGFTDLQKTCQDAIVYVYVRLLTSLDGRITRDRFEASLAENAANAQEIRTLRALVYASIGDVYYARGKRRPARSYYAASTSLQRPSLTLLAKLALLSVGPVGTALRSMMTARRGALT